ncbi:MAG: YbbR-like domain-containing protein [Vicinamibacterales bacterium]
MAYSPFRNLGLKFLSVCIAALLWLVVAGERVVERALRVPVEFQNLPASLEIVGHPPETVDVRLRGSSGALSRLAPGDASAILDLRTARPGRRLFHLTSSQVTAPYGIDVVQVSPSTVPMQFETSGVRVVPVHPSIEGHPAGGYEVVNVSVVPETVEIVGPESALKGLTEAITEPVSLDGRSETVTDVVTVGVADPGVRLREAQTATVTVTVEAVTEERALEGVRVRVRNLGEDLAASLQPATLTVHARGTEEALQALRSAEVEAWVDAAGLAPGQYTLPAHVAVGEGWTVSGTAPETLRVRIRRR